MSPKGGPVVIIHTTYLAQVILSFTRMTQTRESNSQTTFWARFLFSRFFVTSLSENIVVFILQKEQKVCIFFSTLLNKANLGLKKTFFWLHTSLPMSQYIGYMIDQENVWKYDEMLLFHFMLSPVKSWKKQYILRISTKEYTFSYEWYWLW